VLLSPGQARTTALYLSSGPGSRSSAARGVFSAIAPFELWITGIHLFRLCKSQRSNSMRRRILRVARAFPDPDSTAPSDIETAGCCGRSAMAGSIPYPFERAARCGMRGGAGGDLPRPGQPPARPDHRGPASAGRPASQGRRSRPQGLALTGCPPPGQRRGPGTTQHRGLWHSGGRLAADAPAARI
jgi:hypothetical protein